jgi:hypothetical protein
MKSEQIDTRAVLAGSLGDANRTDPNVRLAERARVLAYWPDDLIVEIVNGIVVAPPWRLLFQPTEWSDVPVDQVVAVVRDSLATNGRWPSIDGLRRRFGRVSNHRRGDEVEAQVSLL